MHIDLDHESDRTRFESAVCIIGGGIAGLVIARNLASRGIDVHLLEAGGGSLESRSQDLYSVQMEARKHEGATEGRFRVFGGSSTRWGGQLLPYTHDVFQPPAGTPSAPWPLGSFELETHYAELRRIMHVTERSPAFEFPPSPQSRSSSDNQDVNIRFSKWAPFSKRNLARTIGRECLDSGRVTVFFHANVIRIDTNVEGTRAERAVARNYDGKAYEFHAKHFVVCSGTIESCRLLLASTTVFDCGLGNTTDQVGRYFHDHISVAAATVPDSARRTFAKLFSPIFVDGTLHTPKLEASANLRSEHGLLAVMAHFAIDEPEGSGIAAVRDFLKNVQHGRTLRKLPELLLSAPRHSAEIARVVWCAWVRKRRAISRHAAVTLRIDCEQFPSANNRIKLSSKRDIVGMPLAIVDWRISEEERRTVQTYAKVAERFLGTLGLGPLSWLPELSEQNDSWLAFARDTYHPMGGTRMGTNPQTSVVNPDLQVHGVPNLFVASCSVFPGGGSSNPTFTLMALALRLAGHLHGLCTGAAAAHQQKDMANLTNVSPELVHN